MKKEIEQLISKLGNKADVVMENPDGTKIIRIVPVTMLDVLEKVRKSDFGREEEMMKVAALLTYWRPFGFKTSLNEIYEKAEWEGAECIDSDCPCGKFPLRNDKCTFKSVPKDFNTKALFQFLLQLSL